VRTAQARELRRRHGEHATLLVPICADGHHATALLGRNQVVAQDWSILRMARSLGDPIPMSQAHPTARCARQEVTARRRRALEQLPAIRSHTIQTKDI